MKKDSPAQGTDFALNCPLPASSARASIQMGHGGGGRLTRDLIHKVFLSEFNHQILHEQLDSALVPFEGSSLAFTTDSYVVSPRFFPGGDIGKLAVCGTVNDLAMVGARPLYLSAGFILEEGMDIDELKRIAASFQAELSSCNVALVAADTKVVDRGKGDGVFINTSGVGVVAKGARIHPSRVRKGDAVIVSGDIGRHGMAVMSAREGLSFETPIHSDCAPLHTLVAALLVAGIDIHCLRDPTRGGVATVLNEIASQASVGIVVHETEVPVASQVQGACELLGLDPLYVACEGRMVVFVAEEDADKALCILREYPAGKVAARIGIVSDQHHGDVVLQTRLGTRRLLDMLSGEQLPRIC